MNNISLINRSTLFYVVTIALLGFAVYANSFASEFVWDDEHLIENNEAIKSFSHVPEIFTQDIWGGLEDKGNSYRPFQMVTYMIDHAIWKLKPFGYHLTNTILHIAAALALFWLATLLFNNKLLACIAAAFYVVHPVHTEAVSYIAGRADPLALLLMLLSFIFYIKARPSKSMGAYCLMLICFSLAIISRENALILPCLLLLYHATFKEKFKSKEFFSLLGVALVYFLLRITVLKDLLGDEAIRTTLFERLPGFFVAITNYIGILFVPIGLHMEYGGDLFFWGNPRAILGVIVLFVLVIVTFRNRKRDRLIFFSVSWFLVALLPVSNLYPINAYMAEHWLYVPSIGFFLILAKTILVLAGKKETRDFTIAFAIGLLVFYSVLTVRQNRFWKDPVSFYEQTLKHSSKSARVYNNLGNSFDEQGNNEEKIAAYKKAIELRSDYAEPHFNLGIVYTSMERQDEAIDSYKRAIAIKPDHRAAYNNLGNVYALMDRSEEAIHSYKRAIAIKGDHPKAYNNLGNVYKDSHQYDQDYSTPQHDLD